MKICLLSTIITLLCATHSSASHFLRKGYNYAVTADLSGYGDKPWAVHPLAAYYCSRYRQYTQTKINEVIAFAKALSVFRHNRGSPTKLSYPLQVPIDGFRVNEFVIVHPISLHPQFFFNPAVEVTDYIIMDIDFNLITIVYTVIEEWKSVLFNQCFPLIQTKSTSQVFLYYPGSPFQLPKAIQPEILAGIDDKIINMSKTHKAKRKDGKSHNK
ncbi:unnamed protein product [Blumeria hordei]|uniref:Uncharacterized protein n=1 Tax=Blumeria hordei TaxID=2867405 RepID=A0A383UK85_BLUHO|nr:unnamed protein product [Blumeria hordei]